MALMINDRCINCGYCEKECPNQAIYEPGMEWTLSEGTTLKGRFTLFNGRNVDVNDDHEPLSETHYFIVPEKCAECKNFYSEPQCLVVCPDPESIVVHPGYKETEAELTEKQALLNQQTFTTKN